MKKWIEAMRLRTLPVSLAGVLCGTACALLQGSFNAVVALLCVLFAALAQITSNFGNEYYDYKNGIDKKGREGFRRGVTEGEISPVAMKRATYTTLSAAIAVGCTMLFYGPWWLLLVGVVIMLFALGYSAGPYPLSHHGLGDVAVIIFFGIVPVTFTCFLQTGSFDSTGITLLTSFAVGLLAANVLIVNNYRDMEDDKAVNKNTTVVIFGRKVMACCYLLAGFVAMVAMVPVWQVLRLWSLPIVLVYLVLHCKNWQQLKSAQGAALNPLLGKTAIALLVFSLMFLIAAIIRQRF
ncbi:MAG: 1,4-dihydroxy-2-naphthoate octaprenyltransferase [Bacteroidaceae bacterium]|nr:1,4-dihydroxy-2-naphthoate octaprenyltransferase [Bacteroidaceae bacterium]